MPKVTATLALNGEIVLRDFDCAIHAFTKLMSSLSREVADAAKAEWVIDSLEISSAIATVRGLNTTDPDDTDSIERIIDAYEEVGLAIQDQSAIPYGPGVRDSAKKLGSLVKGRVSSIRFETETFDAEVFSASIYGTRGPKGKPEIVHGAAQGRVQSMTSRGGLRFTVYDIVDDHAISCYLMPRSEDLMRDAWGRLALVEGTIRRNPITGLISTVREVGTVSFLDEARAGDWREAIGCAPAMEGSISPEEAVRRMRDA